MSRVAGRHFLRGFVESTGSPDLRFAYDTASHEKLESNPVRGGNFGGSVNVGSPGVRKYQEGTLVIHAIDTGRNA